MTRDDRPIPPPATGGDARDARSSDRRTLIVAVVAMVAMVVAGIAAGARFAGTTCRDLAVEVRAGDAAARTADVTDRSGSLAEGLDDLAAVLGPVRAQVVVDGAVRLAPVPGGVAVLAPSRMVVVDDDGTVRGGATTDGASVVVGDGADLYALVVPNAATGQVDALRPLTVAVGATPVVAGTCVDTALVGSPLAFVLDAGDGELLLLRAQEDGDDAELELRDPVAGRRWAARLALRPAPAGLMAARTSAGLGPDAVVVAQRTSAGEPGEGIDAAWVLAGHDRDDGAPRWTLDRAALAAAGVELAATADDLVAEVVLVGADEALVLLEPATAAAGDAQLRTAAWGPLADDRARAARIGTLVAVGTADGAVRDVASGVVVLAALRAPDGAVRVVTSGGPPAGSSDGMQGTGALDAEAPTVRIADAGPRGTVTASGDRVAGVRLEGARLLDLVAVGGRTWVLVGADGEAHLIGLGP